MMMGDVMPAHINQSVIDNRLVDAVISDTGSSLARHREVVLRRIQELSDEQKALLDIVLIQKTSLQKAAELLGCSQKDASGFYADALRKIKQSATLI